jgi:hypothetical protein
MLEQAVGTCLENWAELYGCATRICYGDDPDKKPDAPCRWDAAALIPGWYETDESLRERIL